MNLLTQREAVDRIGQSRIVQSEYIAGLRGEMRQFASLNKYMRRAQSLGIENTV